MPIKAKNKALYPKDWKALREKILDRANHCCEGSPRFPECRAANRQPHPITGSDVVLTIAHLDHNPLNNGPENLRAWCQKCHNVYDHPHRMKNARETRAARKAVNQVELL